MKSKVITFKLDSFEWEGGVSDNFAETPLGILSKPLGIEQIAEVEWTIVFDNFISIHPINPDIQLKYWLKIPEKPRKKIRYLSETIFPFHDTNIYDRYLLAYSVENEKDKYIGFTFESMLSESKVGIYVYTQAKINCSVEAKDFLQKYLEELLNLDINSFESNEQNKSRLEKFLELFRFR